MNFMSNLTTILDELNGQPTTGSDPTWSQKWLTGYTDPNTNTNVDGYAKTGLDIGSGILNAYLGMQQYGLAKDNLNFQKEAYKTNLNNQRTLTNAQLSDRQTARSAYSSSFTPVSQYMQENGI